MFTRHFTLDEANALLPLAKEACEKIRELVSQQDALRERLGKSGRGRSSSQVSVVGVEADRARLSELSEDIGAQITRLHELGGQIKGLDPFLVDFPALLDGKTVLLCWREGEDTVAHFHTVEGGYSSRVPIEHPADFGSPVIQ